MTLSQDLHFETLAERATQRTMAIVNYLQAHPHLDLQANVGLLEHYIGNHTASQENIERAVKSLGSLLAIKKTERLQDEAEEADEVSQQQLADERASLVEQIVSDYSKDVPTQNFERQRLESRAYPIEFLREQVNVILSRKHMRSMSLLELKNYSKERREAGLPLEKDANQGVRIKDLSGTL